LRKNQWKQAFIGLSKGEKKSNGGGEIGALRWGIVMGGKKTDRERASQSSYTRGKCYRRGTGKNAWAGEKVCEVERKNPPRLPPKRKTQQSRKPMPNGKTPMGGDLGGLTTKFKTFEKTGGEKRGLTTLKKSTDLPGGKKKESSTREDSRPGPNEKRTRS